MVSCASSKLQMERMNAAALTILKTFVGALSPQHVYPSDYLFRLMKEQSTAIRASNLKLTEELTNDSEAHFIMEDMKGEEWESTITNIKANLEGRLNFSVTAVDITGE